MTKLKVSGQQYNIQIGHRGESAAKAFVIDIAPWLEEWPTGLGVVLVKRPKDKQYYMARNIVQDNSERTLTWRPDATDTEYVCIDKPVKVQVVFSDGDVVLAKTPVWLCRVMPSLEGTEIDPPELVTPWVSSVLAAAVEATQSASSAAQSANSAQSAATDARQSKEASRGYSDSAGVSAGEARGYAASAGRSATLASTSADNAEEAAQSAADDADRAETAASQAEERSQQTIDAAESVSDASAVIISAKGEAASLVAQAEQHANNARINAQSAGVSAGQALSAAQSISEHIGDAEAYAIRAEEAAAESEVSKDDAEQAARDAQLALDHASDYADRTIQAAEMIEDNIAYIETAADVVEDLTKQAAFHEAAALEYSESSAASARHSRWFWEKIVKFGTGIELADIQSDWLENDETAAEYIKNRTHYIVRDAGTYNLFAPKAVSDGRLDDYDYLEPLPEGWDEGVQPESWTITHGMKDGDWYRGNHPVLILYELQDPFPLKETFTVTWDGTEYTGLTIDTDGVISGDDFKLEYESDTDEDGITIFRLRSYSKDSGEHTFSISSVSDEIVYRIDEKYLPVNPHFDGEVTALRYKTKSGLTIPAWWVLDEYGAPCLLCVKGENENAVP